MRLWITYGRVPTSLGKIFAGGSIYMGEWANNAPGRWTCSDVRIAGSGGVCTPIVPIIWLGTVLPGGARRASATL